MDWLEPLAAWLGVDGDAGGSIEAHVDFDFHLAETVAQLPLQQSLQA